MYSGRIFQQEAVVEAAAEEDQALAETVDQVEVVQEAVRAVQPRNIQVQAGEQLQLPMHIELATLKLLKD